MKEHDLLVHQGTPTMERFLTTTLIPVSIFGAGVLELDHAMFMAKLNPDIKPSIAALMPMGAIRDEER